ncbi:unnamed protein product, partial [Closterium sp. Naga37s-1]
PYSTATRMSDALFERIQRYTKTHAACTAAVADWPAFFNDPAQGLSSSSGAADAAADCKYLLWLEPTFNGLGNQLLSLVSAFIYALLTDRTLLISPAAFNARLLCNPFPHSSWRPSSLSSEDFDLMAAVARNHMVGRMVGMDDGARGVFIISLMAAVARNHMVGRMVGMDDGARGGDEEQRHPNAAFSDLSCRANVSDLAFYCPKVQKQISAIRFLGLDTEEYILPALYLVPEFDAELERLVPDRLPLMHVGRYLLHPANYLWEEITRAFRAYLAPYQHRVGIQIRDFTTETADEPQVIQRTMQCAVNISKGLPPLMEHARWKSIMNEEVAPTAVEQQWLDQARDKAYDSSSSPRSIGVLVASLKRSYQDAIRDAYVEGVPLGGHDVAVTSLSHESGQTYGEERQLELALKEMWLLSMCDLLLVSDSSTFGYMAAGLAGVSPFSLNIVRRMGADWDVNGRPACEVTTPEPCYLSMLEPQQRQIQKVLSLPASQAFPTSCHSLLDNVHHCTMPRAPPKGRAPLMKKQNATEDSQPPADKGKEKVDDEVAETIHTEGSSSGLSLEEKLAALTSAHADADDFTDDDSDDELEFDVTKDLVAKQRFTAILLLPFILQQEMAAVILTVRMLLKRVWSSLLSDGANTHVGFQYLFPAYVAKTKYSRLQLSFLKEEDAVNVRQASLDCQRANSSMTYKLHWLHAENVAFTRLKASNARAVEVVF